MKRSTLGFTAISLLVIAGCPVTADDLCAKGTCERIVDATSPSPEDGGAPDDGIVVEPRDPCIDKPSAPECVTNDSALFVSKSADPNGADGTIAHPYPSIATALAKVTNEKKRVYVCDGTYEEQISIEGIASTLIGGLACDFRGAGPKPKLTPKSGTALSVAGVGGASVIDITIEASSDANTPGSSAIGVFITSAADILLRGVDITAGAGQGGTDGGDASSTANHSGGTAPFAQNGSGTGAPTTAPTCTACVDGSKSIAGNGGGTNPNIVLATPGDASPTKVGTGNAGGTNIMACGPGLPGTHGPPAPQAIGGTVPGTLGAKGWNDRTTTAQAGKSGLPGQGGGGGGTVQTGSGGTGACGGCGGGGGAAGSDGGSSIGVLVHQSTKIVIEKSNVTAGTGGKGGNGGKGQKGQGAPSGGGSGVGGGCSGGAGGHGAGGGGGGGGVGGYSVGIAYIGPAPETPQSVVTKGAAGIPGTGGKGGDPGGIGGNKGNDGAGGSASRAEAVLNLAP